MSRTQERADYHREWARQNPAVLRRYNLKRLYGLTPDDVAEKLVEQGGVCAICGGGPGGRAFHVDHDHETGAFRGLLCGPCNRGIGYLKDDANRLLAAAAYLIQHEEVFSWSSST